MFVLESEEYNAELINLVNNTKLPVSLIYYITKNFFNEIEKVYQQALSHAHSSPSEEGLIDMNITADGDISWSEHQEENQAEE